MLIFDISTLASAGGQAVSVVRVVRELAIWAYAHRSDVAFVLYDTKIEAYCQIQPRWTKALVDGSAMVDMSTLPNRDAEKSRLRDRGATFCVYPSLYEGYGLPIVESFRHRKAVLSSSGGALPETVGDLSPCLDPQDEQAWYETLKCWTIDPATRAGTKTPFASGSVIGPGQRRRKHSSASSIRNCDSAGCATR